MYFDESLHTNQGSFFDEKMHDKTLALNSSFKKGDPLGEFRMGSTIVLIFEAPPKFKFSVMPGQQIKMGQGVGCVGESNFSPTSHPNIDQSKIPHPPLNQSKIPQPHVDPSKIPHLHFAKQEDKVVKNENNAETGASISAVKLK